MKILACETFSDNVTPLELERLSPVVGARVGWDKKIDELKSCGFDAYVKECRVTKNWEIWLRDGPGYALTMIRHTIEDVLSALCLLGIIATPCKYAGIEELAA